MYISSGRQRTVRKVKYSIKQVSVCLFVCLFVEAWRENCFLV